MTYADLLPGLCLESVILRDSRDDVQGDFLLLDGHFHHILGIYLPSKIITRLLEHLSRILAVEDERCLTTHLSCCADMGWFTLVDLSLRETPSRR